MKSIYMGQNVLDLLMIGKRMLDSNGVTYELTDGALYINGELSPVSGARWRRASFWEEQHTIVDPESEPPKPSETIVIANINQDVRVKLTDFGLRVYSDYILLDPETRQTRVDPDDCILVETMWMLMKIFGVHMMMSRQLFVANRIEILPFDYAKIELSASDRNALIRTQELMERLQIVSAVRGDADDQENYASPSSSAIWDLKTFSVDDSEPVEYASQPSLLDAVQAVIHKVNHG